MKRLSLFLFFSASVTSSATWAQELIGLRSGPPSNEISIRLDRLEAENRLLREQLGKLLETQAPPTGLLGAQPAIQLGDTVPISVSEADEVSTKLAQLQAAQQQLGEGMAKLQDGLEQVGKNLKITTVDKAWGIGVFGSLNAEMLFADARASTPSAPLFLFPDFGRDTKTYNVHAHSTNFGLALQGPQLGDLRAGGLFLTYLWGEQFEADRYGFFVVRAYGELKNEWVRYSFGLDGDVMNPLSPMMVNFNAGQLGGNFGFFRAQLRRERYWHLSPDAQITTQFALTDPVTTSFADFTLPPNRLLEDAGWPLLQGRIALGLGPKCGQPGQETRPFELGFSGVGGELRRTDFPGPNRDFEVWAVGADARWEIDRFWGLKGEFFHGQAIGNFNASILQVNNDLLDPVRGTGGWGELYVYWLGNLHSHFGTGVDDPLDSDLLAGLAAARPNRNQFAFGNLIWDITKNLEFGFEVSHFETSYVNVTPLDIDASSWVYHSRVRLKF